MIARLIHETRPLIGHGPTYKLYMTGDIWSWGIWQLQINVMLVTTDRVPSCLRCRTNQHQHAFGSFFGRLLDLSGYSCAANWVIKSSLEG